MESSTLIMYSNHGKLCYRVNKGEGHGQGQDKFISWLRVKQTLLLMVECSNII